MHLEALPVNKSVKRLTGVATPIENRYIWDSTYQCFSQMKNIPVRNINAVPEEPDFSKSFSIRDLRDLLAGKDLVQELHRHNFFYVLALKKGSGHHEIDFTSYNVADNTVFFMRPGQVHQLTLKAGSTGYLMAFRSESCYSHGKSSNQLLRRAGAMNHYQLNPHGYKKLHAILTYVFAELSGKQEQYQEVIKANLHIFLIELVRQSSKGITDNVKLYAQEQLESFLGMLEHHVASHKQASEYADMLHLSLYQLNAITRSTLGKTCSAIINEYIILESKRLLLATSNQVNQIASQLGYEDVSYFIRFFKKHTGHSPEVFRQNFR
jgi:AraC-like DNA-binding protein